MSDLTPDLNRAVLPLLRVLTPDEAMSQLVVRQPADPGIVALAEEAIKDPAFADKPALQAALWLYVDELDRSHAISQHLEDATGSFLHGIMHRREGDFANSHHWFRKAGKHPAMSNIAPGYDPHRLIDDVQVAVESNQQRDDLVELQRAEWVSLFTWCDKNS